MHQKNLNAVYSKYWKFCTKNEHPMMQKLATKIYGMLRTLKLISTPAIWG
jgi:hypothetical protein